MYRKKNKFVHSILFRISIWILLLGLAGMLLVTYVVGIQMRYQLEKQITEELQRVRDNSLLYVQQIMLLNDSRMNEKGFVRYRNEIEDQLDRAGYQRLLLCSSDGGLLCGDLDGFDARSGQEDFLRARNGESAFTIYYENDGRCVVHFSMPVILQEQSIGMICCYFDYSEMYGREWAALERMIYITLLVFALICLVIWLTVFRILSPIRNLSRASSDISLHLIDGELDDGAIEGLQFQKRRDEIGELSSSYLEMLHVIKEQFQKIQEDKDRILELWNSRQEFYNNVTHELKTPLTTISGYAQLMEKNGPGEEDLFYHGTSHILKESNRLHRMVVQLLELQDQAQGEEIKRLDLSQLLKSVSETMEIKAGRYNNILALTGTEMSFFVMGREDKLRQVLINVIDNAIKYGEPEKEIRLGIACQDDQVKITITNQGRGIREEELEAIFEPFYRADKSLSRELGSSGLGLSISARIMEEHGGTIFASSIPGGETTFTVCFPETEQEEGI